MLDANEAYKIIKRELPQGKIQAYVSYKDFFIFQVFRDDPFEEECDPFYSVSKLTGKFSDFSILTDGNTAEIISLFTKAKSNKPERGNYNG